MLRSTILVFLMLSLSGCSLWRKVFPPKIIRVHYTDKSEFEKQMKVRYEVAYEDYKSGKYLSAIEQFKFIQKNYTASLRFVDAVYFEARSYEKLKQFEKAIGRYRYLMTLSGAPRGFVAQSMYRISFCYEVQGEDAKTIAALQSMQGFTEELPERVIKAEIPARLAASYIRVGEPQLSNKYFAQAEEGVRDLRVKHQVDVLPDWFVQTLFFMGDLRVEPKKEEMFSASILSLKKAQSYLLQAIEAENKAWSEKAHNRLVEVYVKFWNFLQNYKGKPNSDVVLQKHETQKKQWEMALQLLQSLEALHLAQTPSAQSQELMEKTNAFAKALEGEIQSMLNQPQEGRGLTPRALEIQGLKRKGRIISVNPENQTTTPQILDTTDPNL